MSIDGRYEVKKGDTLWGVAKQQLKASGNQKPTKAQIIIAMNKIAEANGCEGYQACSDKFFNRVGSELNVQGLFVEKTQDSTFVDFNDGATGKKEVPKEGLTFEKRIAELSPEDLKKIKEKFTSTNLKELSNEDLKKIIATIQEKFEPVELTKADGEAGGLPTGWEKIHKKMHKKLLEQATTMAVGEEGGKADEKVIIPDEKFKKILEELKNKKQNSRINIHKLTKEELKEILDAIRALGKDRLDGATTKSIGEEGGSPSVTYALGENGSSIGTTKSMGEEGGGITTMLLNEEGGSNGVTYALGENGSNIETTKSMGEEGGGITTMLLNEEGGSNGVTYALGENGSSIGTTKSMGEEGGGMTTMALGEEGGTVVTYALGENGDSSEKTIKGITTMAVGEEGGDIINQKLDITYGLGENGDGVKF